MQLGFRDFFTFNKGTVYYFDSFFQLFFYFFSAEFFIIFKKIHKKPKKNKRVVWSNIPPIAFQRMNPRGEMDDDSP